jgi:hypothetical protein
LGRCRHRRHRLDALATFRRQQPRTVIPQWQSPIRVSDHARQFLDISDKPVRSIDYGCEIQIPRLDAKNEPRSETDAAVATFLAFAKTTVADAPISETPCEIM